DRLYSSISPCTFAAVTCLGSPLMISSTPLHLLRRFQLLHKFAARSRHIVTADDLAYRTNSFCAGGDHLIDIVQLNAADSHEWNVDFACYLAHILRRDRSGHILLRLRGKDRSYANIIGAVSLRLP